MKEVRFDSPIEVVVHYEDDTTDCLDRVYRMALTDLYGDGDLVLEVSCLTEEDVESGFPYTVAHVDSVELKGDEETVIEGDDLRDGSF